MGENRHILVLGVGLLCVYGFVGAQVNPTEPREIILDEVVPDVALNFVRNSIYASYRVTLKGAKGTGLLLSLWKEREQTLDTEDYVIWTLDDKTPENVNGSANIGRFKEKKATGSILLERSQSWSSNSNVSFVVTMYKNATDGKCSADYYPCSCTGDKRGDSSEESDEYDGRRVTRCVPYILWNNGRSNCGDCNDRGDSDDGTESGKDKQKNISWYDVQYLLTILLAGLFFILSPICIVIFLFYHRRMSAAAARDLERTTPEYSVSPPNDLPPSYEDLHDAKNLQNNSTASSA